MEFRDSRRPSPLVNPFREHRGGQVGTGSSGISAVGFVVFANGRQVIASSGRISCFHPPIVQYDGAVVPLRTQQFPATDPRGRERDSDLPARKGENSESSLCVTSYVAFSLSSASGHSTERVREQPYATASRAHWLIFIPDKRPLRSHPTMSSNSTGKLRVLLTASISLLERR